MIGIWDFVVNNISAQIEIHHTSKGGKKEKRKSLLMRQNFKDGKQWTTDGEKPEGNGDIRGGEGDR